MISISGNIQGLTLRNNSETCPYCGGIAFVADGIFDIANDVISVINAPSFTKEMLQKLGGAVVDAYKNPEKTDELIKFTESIDPNIAKTVKHLASSHKFIGLFLLALAIKSCDVNVNVSLDANQLIDQMKSEPPQAVDIEAYRPNESNPPQPVDIKTYKI
jgi:hypothetical protein